MHAGLGFPAEFGLGLGIVADEEVDFGGAEETFVELHVGFPVEVNRAE